MGDDVPPPQTQQFVFPEALYKSVSSQLVWSVAKTAHVLEFVLVQELPLLSGMSVQVDAHALQLPPQSTSVSSPFLISSVQVGDDVPAMQLLPLLVLPVR